jgi:hypothetical protein
MAQTYNLLGLAQTWTGDIVKGARQQQRAIDLFRLLGDKKGLISTLPSTGLSVCPAIYETEFMVMRKLEECERDAREAVELARQIDWPAGEAFAEASRGILLASIGQFGRGLAHVHKGLQIAMEIDHQQWICNAHCESGHIYVLMLEPALALRHLDTGWSLAKTLGETWFMESICAYQVLAYLQTNHHQQAEATLQAVMPRGQEPRTWSERRLGLGMGRAGPRARGATGRPTDRRAIDRNRAGRVATSTYPADSPALETQGRGACGLETLR